MPEATLKTRSKLMLRSTARNKPSLWIAPARFSRRASRDSVENTWVPGSFAPRLPTCSSKPPAAIALNHVDPVRQLVATSFRPRKMRRQHLSARLDRHNKTVGDATPAHVRSQCVDGALPFRLRYAHRNALVGDDARIVLRQGDKDQNAGAIFLAPD